MLLKRSIIVAMSFAAIAVGANSRSLAGACTLADLQWLAGVWRNVPPADPGEERWVSEPDGVLMGSSWAFPKNGRGFAEVMTIAADGDQVLMRLRHFDRALKNAWEDKSEPMAFALSTCAGHSVVFSGTQSHAGERLSYTLSGDELTIVGDFSHQGNPLRVEFHLRKTPD